MTSEMIQQLCLLVAEMGQKAEDGSPIAVQLLNTQFLGEIAYQLARQNEMAHPTMTCPHEWVVDTVESLMPSGAQVEHASCKWCGQKRDRVRDETR